MLPECLEAANHFFASSWVQFARITFDMHCLDFSRACTDYVTKWYLKMLPQSNPSNTHTHQKKTRDHSYCRLSFVIPPHTHHSTESGRTADGVCAHNSLPSTSICLHVYAWISIGICVCLSVLVVVSVSARLYLHICPFICPYHFCVMTFTCRSVLRAWMYALLKKHERASARAHRFTHTKVQYHIFVVMNICG